MPGPRTPEERPAGRSVLICHDGEPLDRHGLARWLASFTELAGIVAVHEPPAVVWRRARRQLRRVGTWRFLDVLAFQAYSRWRLAAADRRWAEETLRALEARYPAPPPGTRVFDTPSPNSPETARFLRELQPDIVLARSKIMLKERIFGVARTGTFVMHPGICPEYRNSHGCFWALAMRDTGNVGMTLLKIDAGIDTGPVYGYYRCDYDEARESHTVIQQRVVFDNLDALEDKFLEILAGTAATLDTTGRKSGEWGQPWLTSYLRWKLAARRTT